MFSNSVANKVKSEFKREYNVAVFPDFPHLISSPDILIGGNGRLCAIFTIKVAEMTQPDLLLSRLVLTRLGLPDNLISVLVMPSNKDFQEMTNAVIRNFDLSVTDENIKPIKKMVESDYKSRKLISETRRQTIARYSRFYYENSNNKPDILSRVKPEEILYELKAKGGYETIQAKNWNLQDETKKGKHLEALLIRERVTVLAGDFENKTAPLARLRKFCFHSLKYDYQLDNGVPYIFNPKVNILVIDKIPQYKFDPQKPLRASAFSGIVLSQVDRVDDIEYLSDKLEKSLDRIR